MRTRTTRRALAVTALTVAVLALPNVASGAGTAPVAREDSYGARTDAPLRIPASRGVLSNDTSSDRTQLRAVLLVAPQHGRVTLAPDGSFTYRPDTGYQGRDAFGYRAQDGNGRSAMRPVKLLVNKAPTARGDEYQVLPNSRFVLPSPGVLANDTDGFGTPLTAVYVTGAAHGAAVLNAAGALDYRPDHGYRGLDTIEYAARDRYGLTSTTVTVTIHVNTPPTALPDSFTVQANRFGYEVFQPGVLTNDSDAELDRLDSKLVGLPSSGRVILEDDGSFRVWVAPGDDTDIVFRYRLWDGSTFGAPTTVLLHVLPYAASQAGARSGSEP